MFRTKLAVFILAGFVALIINTSVFASTQKITPQTEEKVRAVLESCHVRYDQRDVNGIFELLHPNCEEPPKKFLKEALGREFEKNDLPKSEFSILSIDQFEDKIAVEVSSNNMWLVTGKEEHLLYILKPQNDELLIHGIYEKIDPNDFDANSGIYTSNKGKFSLTIPKGWILLKGVWILRAVAPDSATILAPDLESKVMMGLAQLPMKLDPNETIAAKIAIEADSAMAKRESSEYIVCEQGPASLGDMKGYKHIAKAKAKDSNAEHKLMRAYYSDSPMLYFFICDAIGYKTFDTLQPQFEEIITSFNMSPVDEKLSRQEVVAAEQAKGDVAGRVYSSKEFNCFIAAPQGWEIRTSPNPAHLVEMQYTKGRSIARLIAAKGLQHTDKLNDIFSKRLDAVKTIVQDFYESSRQEVTIHETPGIES
ncbi:MAG: hypothetical protein KAR20_16970, partial [Candidatus Heimdallarchaeota archaeon]|nr:hypothetical protein [Candidatus Heimdallarchaeota archaeon]